MNSCAGFESRVARLFKDYGFDKTCIPVLMAIIINEVDHIYGFSDYGFLESLIKAIENRIGDYMDTEDKKRKTKIITAKIASAQLRLNRLQHKSKVEAKQIETRQKIILGAEGKKQLIVMCLMWTKNWFLVFFDIGDLNDEEVIKYKKKGRAFLRNEG
jgi:hypothetical protein